jgi:hypothetical protein
MRNLVALPVLGLAVIIQSAIVSRFSLLSGFADLTLVVLAAWALQDRVNTAFHWAFLASILFSFVSHLPWLVVVVGYFGVVMLAQLLQQRVWQAPLLAMFSVTFLGTIFVHFLSYGFLRLAGDPLPLGEAMGLITLPSLLLNLFVSVPVYAVMRDLARWVFPGPETA